jgi:hypothetical protein
MQKYAAAPQSDQGITGDWAATSKPAEAAAPDEMQEEPDPRFRVLLQ